MIQVKSSHRRTILFMLLGITLIVLGLAGLGPLLGVAGGVIPFTASDTSRNAGASPSVAKAGQLAPEIALKDLAGNPVKLTEMKGKPVLVTFWATWCVPCRTEMPIFEKKYQQYKDSKNFVVLGVDVQQEEGVDAVRQFLSQVGVSFPILLDEDGSAESAYRIQALPTNVFIDRRGVIEQLRIGGPVSEEFVEGELQKIFGGGAK